MAPVILLLNPPVYDFAAYDFWLKPYGLLSAAGFLRGKADFAFFDFLDRRHPFMTARPDLACDKWGKGRFFSQIIPAPAPLVSIPRYFRRFGLPREIFRDFLSRRPGADFVLVQTMMTYWYPGLVEVIEDIRHFWPSAKIILGGNYVTLCLEHAQKLNADLLITGNKLDPLWQYLKLRPDLTQPALWEVCGKLAVGVLKLTQGCPFTCTYCSVPKVYGRFEVRPLDRTIAEIDLLVRAGVQNIAFYDDALLFRPDDVLVPFLQTIIARKISVNFHSPNALNARFITADLAQLMVQAGFKTFFLGFESSSAQWQKLTGSKVFSEELAQAVGHLKAAGADPRNITAYQILGHPHIQIQQLEESIKFVHSLGIRGTLADFSPIPGTVDGDYCRKWVDTDEPLFHNKTAFPIILLGNNEVNRIKDVQRKLNRALPSASTE